MTATKSNTIFVTVDAYPTRSVGLPTVLSARKCDVYLHVRDQRQKWRGFFEHKVNRMYSYLLEQLSMGKEYVFLLDGSDVFFVGHETEILKRYNDMTETGKVVFTAEYFEQPWPYNATWFMRSVQQVMNDPAALLNAGCVAGRIADVLNLFVEAKRVRISFECEQLTTIAAKRIFQDCGKKYIDDDQFLYSIVQLYNPHLFQIDTKKQLFANVGTLPTLGLLQVGKNRTCSLPLRDWRNTGQALILHATGARNGHTNFLYLHDLHEHGVDEHAPTDWKQREIMAFRYQHSAEKRKK